MKPFDRKPSTSLPPVSRTPERGTPDTARRNFLAAATGAGALGALAVLSGSGGTAEVVAAVTPAEPAVSGYHETEHIRQYYRTARYW